MKENKKRHKPNPEPSKSGSEQEVDRFSNKRTSEEEFKMKYNKKLDKLAKRIDVDKMCKEIREDLGLKKEKSKNISEQCLWECETCGRKGHHKFYLHARHKDDKCSCDGRVRRIKWKNAW